mmetsp:Transcript_29408/g.83739  ORF Transcript_29408/g.83739 Transcript_29408/m.83739 type:complete len:240 (-) Transcript_29408:191-910(-)
MVALGILRRLNIGVVFSLLTLLGTQSVLVAARATSETQDLVKGPVPGLQGVNIQSDKWPATHIVDEHSEKFAPPVSVWRSETNHTRDHEPPASGAGSRLSKAPEDARRSESNYPRRDTMSVKVAVAESGDLEIVDASRGPRYLFWILLPAALSGGIFAAHLARGENHLVPRRRQCGVREVAPAMASPLAGAGASTSPPGRSWGADSAPAVVEPMSRLFSYTPPSATSSAQSVELGALDA